MTTFPLRLLRLARPQAWFASLILSTLLAAGCATQRQVKEIVAESNAALLASELGDYDLVANPGAGKSNAVPPWEAASRKIDVFIQAHPDQPVANSALRIRQAVILLAHGQEQLALAAFNEARESDLKTDRDKALKRLAKHLVWWYENSANPTWNDPQRLRAGEALTAFDSVLPDLQQSPDIRDFLAEMRAWIGLTLAKESQGEAKRDTFVDTLNRYSDIFTAEDLVILNGGQNTGGVEDFTVAVRRRLRAQAVINKARELKAAPSLASLNADSLRNPEFGRLIFKTP